ncbi:MAG: diguanylate cyclase, partial [Dehalococcoidales bacterium]|nr:diguanylate cyclase [Dehalococcoidales bacterium]
MNVYAVIPAVAIIAYIPLLVTTLSSHPRQRQHLYFAAFLGAAILWSLFDFFFRGNILPQYRIALWKATVISFTLMVAQFHVFASAFYEPGRGRWIPFGYLGFVLALILTSLNYIPENVYVDGEKLYPVYGKYVLIIAAPMLILTARGVYILIRRLKQVDNPVLYNQIISILAGIGILAVFACAAFLPFGREHPISHLGNAVNAFVLSYATIRHRLVDIKLIIRQGVTWISLAIMGVLFFWLLLIIFHSAFKVELDQVAFLATTVAAVITAVFIYLIRGYFFEFTNRALQGSLFNYRQQLREFTGKIHSIFSLREQGVELLKLLIKALNAEDACLMFPEPGETEDDFRTHIVEAPEGRQSRFAGMKLRAGNPVIKYLEKERKLLTREQMDVLPAFLALWPQEKEEIDRRGVEIFSPLISRERLIAILALGRKVSGRYSLDDFNIIEDVTSRVAVSLDKEFLAEQLREREAELSVINNSSVILSSSLDIQQIFSSFIEELKKVLDIAWATIVLIEDQEFKCVALSSPEGSAYQVGEKLPLEGTGTAWVVAQKRPFVEPDLSKGQYFITGKRFYELGLRTVVYLPLVAKGKAIGSFIVASRQPNAYSTRQIRLLEQLASQIAMPLENSLLYAKAEKRARIDELTDLLNRRSLDETIDNEISRHSRYGGVFTLAILDLDSFKKYNDTYGHPAGDRLLRKVGQIIRSSIRNVDYAFRYGGDEFAILLPQTHIADAQQVVERIRKNVANELKLGDISITTSIGVAGWPDDGVTHTDILAAADVALYYAKRSGGNRVYCASKVTFPSRRQEGTEGVHEGIDRRYFGIVHALSDLVDAKSPLTNAHSRKVRDAA